ncbi:MAG TPA: hypothetical protein HPP54_08055 [Nitrospinae bacterium]|nr:hypothetical protein [Nitrospinota bacterium]
MQTQVQYEWDLELMSLDGVDIVEHDFSPTLKKLMTNRVRADGCYYVLVLFRQTGNPDDGALDAQWAYLTEDGDLPDTFDHGAAIPVRYRREFERERDWASRMIGPDVKG